MRLVSWMGKGWAKKFWVLAAVLVVLNAAGIIWIHHDLVAALRSPKGKLRILSVLPTAAVEDTDRFVLVFDEPLATSTILNSPLAKSPFQISPAPAGHWQWAAADRLEFVLDKPLAPGRRFTIRPAADYEVQTGRSIVGQSEFQFKTKPLAMLNCFVRHCDPTNVDIELVFNQPVHPQELLDHLAVRDTHGNTLLKTAALTHQPAEKLVVRVSRPEGKLDVRVAGTLTGHGGQLDMGGDRLSLLDVSPKFALVRADVTPPGTDKDIVVHLEFTAELDHVQALPAAQITLTPPVAGVTVTHGQHDSLRLAGPFECGRRYKVEVNPPLRSNAGEVLKEKQTTYFNVPQRQPTLSFVERNGVLSPYGNMNLDLRVANVSGMRVNVARLHANNLAYQLADRGRYTDFQNLARDMPERTIKLNMPPNTPADVTLDLASLLQGKKDAGKEDAGTRGRGDAGTNEVSPLAVVPVSPRPGVPASSSPPPLGVYQIRVDASDRNWTQDTAVVAVTDLGITAKQCRDGYLIWVTSLRTAKPVEGVKIAAITRNNQTVATATTDSDGLTTLRLPANHPDGPVWLITAEAGNDLSYLKPEEHSWALDDEDRIVGGCPTPQNYDVMLYAERGVYRPGETVHLTGIVRDAAGQIPPPFPMAIVVSRPDGKRVCEIPVGEVPSAKCQVPNEVPHSSLGICQGVFHADFVTDPEARQGRYNFAVVLPKGGDVLGEAEALVESFVPVRLEVKAQSDKKRYSTDEDIRIAANAGYLFGQPGAGLPVGIAGSFRRMPFESKQAAHAGFTFGRAAFLAPLGTRSSDGDHEAEADLVSIDNSNLKTPTTMSSLDDQGKATLIVRHQLGGAKGKGLWAGSIAVSVTEPGGRSVAANVSVSVDTANRYLGLRLVNAEDAKADRASRAASTFVRPDKPARVEWVQLLGDTRAASPGPIQYELYRVEYDWTAEEHDVYRRHRGGGTQRVWKSVERLIPIQSGRIGRAGHSIVPKPTTQPARSAAATQADDTGTVPSKIAATQPGSDDAADCPAEASGSFEVLCPAPGSYRLIATDKLSGTSTVLAFAAVEGGDDSPGNSVPRPEKVDITLDRPDYVPGSSARVLVRSPFGPGRLLLTIETDRIIEQRVIELTGKTAEVDLPVTPLLRGGGFVVATVVRPIDPQAEKWLPHRATGIARLKINPAAHRVEVAIDAPAKVLPGQKIRVTVKMPSPPVPDRPGVVHLWAVDDGILLTTSFTVPDPIKHFFAPRRLEVVSSDTYFDLLPDYKRPLDIARIGGDGDERRQRIRRNPVAKPVRQPAVLWQTAAPVGPDGTLTVEFDLAALPEFTGRMKLMAVAVDYDRYGTAEQPVTVTSPLLVEASWPRFAAPGDRFAVPVKLFNTTTQPVEASVRLDVTGPVRLKEVPSAKCQVPSEPATQRDTSSEIRNEPASAPDAVYRSKTVRIAAGRNATIWFEAEAAGIGPVSVSVLGETTTGSPRIPPVAQILLNRNLITLSNLRGCPAPKETKAADEKFAALAKATFTVRPAAPPHSTAKLFEIPASQPGDRPLVIAPDAEFMLGTTRTTVTISGRPSVQLCPVIEQLIGYPYGCVEQTTSKLYAMLYAPAILPPDDVRVAQVRKMIEAGIMRLWSMQTHSGGLAYWPGDQNPCTWGTAYAAGFLAQAKKAGYELDPQFTKDLVDYLGGLLKVDNGAKPLDSNTIAMVCYLLATLGRPQENWLNQLGDHPDDLDIAGRAYLAAGWIEAGRKDLALKALPRDTMDLVVATATGGGTGRITSQIGQYGVLLNVLIDLDPEHPWIVPLIRKLEKARTARAGWGNTYENATCLAALARYQAMAASEMKRVRFTGVARAATGQTDHSKKFDQNHPIRVTGDGAISIASSGNGSIYLAAVTEGLLRQGARENYDRQLEVRRRWATLDGKPIDFAAAHGPVKLKVGDMVQVEVTCRTLGPDGANVGVNNVAIVDALPGGMEIENPRLSTSAREGGGQTVTADRTEFLDDRVILFTSADSSTRVFKYVLRAVTAGSFVVPPVQGSCMYDESFASIHGGGRDTRLEVSR